METTSMISIFTVEEGREINTALFQYECRCHEALRDYTSNPNQLSEEDTRHMDAIRNAIEITHRVRRKIQSL